MALTEEQKFFKKKKVQRITDLLRSLYHYPKQKHEKTHSNFNRSIRSNSVL